MEKLDELIQSIQDLMQLLRDSDGRLLDARRCYTTEEAATVLRVSRTTIQRMVQGGMQYREIIGKGYIFLGSDILDYLDSKTQNKYPSKLKKAS